MASDHLHPLSSEIARLSGRIAHAETEAQREILRERRRELLERRRIIGEKGGFRKQREFERRVAVESGMPGGFYIETEEDQ